MNNEVGRIYVDQSNEQWIKSKYDDIIRNKITGYSLISLSLKNFDEYQHVIGHEKREAAIQKAYELLCGALGEDEFVARIYSCYFNLIVKCEANEPALHEKVRPLHFTVRDGMEKAFGTKLFLEMGFYPIIDFDVDFFSAKFYADETKYGLQKSYIETNYDMYYISFHDQKEEFRKVEGLVINALELDHFKLYLQPKVDMKTGKVHSAEALMRWIDPERGLIPLNHFLPNIEKNGFIRDVDLFLFDKGCQFIEKWKKQYGQDIKISFNLSGAYFNGQYFYPEYKEVFERYDISSKNICIELLESIVLNDQDRLKPVVDNIYKLGFDCALDDFGSGFSSFDILTNIPLSELKIDRSLFQNIDNPKERSLLKHIVEITHEFGMRSVAEGVETKEYADYMKSIGCDYIQGFYYYKPMPVEEFENRFILKAQ